MLASFVIRRTFYETRISLVVDCDRKQADMTVTHRGRIVAMEAIRKANLPCVMTPENANRWLSREIGEHGTIIETLHHHYRQAV